MEDKWIVALEGCFYISLLRRTECTGHTQFPRACGVIGSDYAAPNTPFNHVNCPVRTSSLRKILRLIPLMIWGWSEVLSFPLARAKPTGFWY